jgi:hypothetical protein
MTTILRIALFLLIAPATVFAQVEANCLKKPAKWFACSTDQDCVLVDGQCSRKGAASKKFSGDVEACNIKEGAMVSCAFSPLKAGFKETAACEKSVCVAKAVEQESKIGNATGGECQTTSDCLVGCKTLDSEPTCITKKEGNNDCLKNKDTPIGGLTCGCLPDVKRCGYALPYEVLKP